MIVNDEQFQELLQQQLMAAAQNLWRLLNTPKSILDAYPKRLEQLQTNARQELRRICKFQAPDRGYLEDP